MKPVAKYRKKQSAVYRAIQYTGDNAQELSYIVADNLRIELLSGALQVQVQPADHSYWQAVRVGDWLIWPDRSTEDLVVEPFMGEHFHEVYEPVEDPA